MAVKKKEASLSIEDKLRAALVPKAEQPYPIPENWLWTRLGEISLDPQYGWTTSAASVGDVRLLRTTDITSGQIDWSSVPYCKEIPADLEKYLIREGDIVISRAGSVGFSYLIKNPEKAVFASYLIRFKPLVVQEYLAHFLKSQTYWDAISESSSGIAVPNVNASKLKQISIPVAPLPEQQRIAEKLESLLGKIKEAKALLDEIPEILQNFRQSVLAATTTGKLTEAWREQNGQSEEWQRKRIEHLTTKVGSGATPWGGEAAYKTEGVPFIRSMNVIFFGFKREGLAFLSSEQAYNLRNVEVRSRDVLLNITGASIGRVTTVPPALDGARVNQHVCIIRPKAELLPEFLCWFLSAPDMQQVIGVENYGVTRQALTKQQILDFEVPVPPLSEQHEIVRRVESLFSKADDLEAQYKAAMELIESLPEIILSKAFRGELVPQDPNDEPAFGLLERITFEKEKHETEKVEGTKRKKHKQNV
jgi:type I restriction enzyme S subunit